MLFSCSRSSGPFPLFLHANCLIFSIAPRLLSTLLGQAAFALLPEPCPMP
ncbi:Uncharacterised protein [Raoultella terrigena]|nr:Uncharacterised protein [Raoultella terrigena]